MHSPNFGVPSYTVIGYCSVSVILLIMNVYCVKTALNLCEGKHFLMGFNPFFGIGDYSALGNCSECYSTKTSVRSESIRPSRTTPSTCHSTPFSIHVNNLKKIHQFLCGGVTVLLPLQTKDFHCNHFNSLISDN